MIFVETPIFTKEIQTLMSDDDYYQLQIALVMRPEVGQVIPGSNGLRKLRWNLPGVGKRGGLRVIYYWNVSEDTIYMLLAYKKSEQEDLTKRQIRTLSKLVKEWL